MTKGPFVKGPFGQGPNTMWFKTYRSVFFSVQSLCLKSFWSLPKTGGTPLGFGGKLTVIL